MRILHVSWEYPPLLYGGLGRHVHALAQEQARAGHSVTVLTQLPPGTLEDEVVNGVRIIRIPAPQPQAPREPTELVEWVTGLNFAMAAAAARVVEAVEPDVIHAHDWVVSGAANALRLAAGVPLVTTIHATEAGRHQGWIHGTVSTTIHQREFQLTNLSQRVIACSQRMRDAVITLFGSSPSAVDVIPNGINVAEWAVAEEDVEVARQRWSAHENLVVFVGRLEWEKGVQTLIDAMPLLATAHVHLVIAGTGSYEAALVEQTHELIDAGIITFTGWLPAQELHALQAAADVIVVPSRYEPFGLVALEAGALDVPVVVANTGGLSDVVDDGAAGFMFESGNAAALARAMDEALGDRLEAGRRVAEMRSRLETIYRWDTIAASTVDTYTAAIADAAQSPRPDEVPAPTIPDRNLLGLAP